jgi:TPR repeat protein
MKSRTLFLALVVLAASAVQAAPANTSCAPEAVAALVARASQGDVRAQFWRGTQLEMGDCGPKELERAIAMFRQSASQGFPPAVHVLGVMQRREGKDAEAIKYFEQSAQLGYQAGFADLGFTYGLRDSPVGDAVLSYAWLTVAIARETKAPLREYLESSRTKVARALSENDLAKAQSVAEGLREKFSSIPVRSDKQ